MYYASSAEKCCPGHAHFEATPHVQAIPHAAEVVLDPRSE